MRQDHVDYILELQSQRDELFKALDLIIYGDKDLDNCPLENDWLLARAVVDKYRVELI